MSAGGDACGPGCQPTAEAASASSRSGIPIAGIETIDVPEFHRRLRAQGVKDRSHSAMVCVTCGTVQSMASLVVAGASPEEAETLIGFSCEGRLTGAGPWPHSPNAWRRAVRGCDWSLGGLFRLHRLQVNDGERMHPMFAIATPEQAQALASAIEARSGEPVPVSTGAAGESVVPKADAQTPTQESAQ